MNLAGLIINCGDGLDVKAQVSGRPIGLNLGFELSFNPFSYTPTFRSLAETLPPRSTRVNSSC